MGFSIGQGNISKAFLAISAAERHFSEVEDNIVKSISSSLTKSPIRAFIIMPAPKSILSFFLIKLGVYGIYIPVFVSFYVNFAAGLRKKTVVVYYFCISALLGYKFLKFGKGLSGFN